MSLFQCLPTNVAYNTLLFVRGGHKKLANDNDLLKPFVQLSSKWREAAQMLLCKEFAFDTVEGQSFYIWKSFKQPASGDMIYHNDLLSRVKHVSIKITVDGLVRKFKVGKGIDGLLGNISFPEARKLTFVLDRNKATRALPGEVYQVGPTITSNPLRSDKDNIMKHRLKVNLTRLVKQIEKMAPNLKVTLLTVDSSRIANHIRDFNAMCPLYRLFYNKDYSSYSGVRAAYNLSITSPLSCLDVNMEGNNKMCRKLIIRNSESLQSLKISSGNKMQFNIGHVIGCKEKIVYPKLEKLSLIYNDSENNYRQPTPIDNDYAPFPSLVHLETRNQFTILDNILFRGNEATLKVLNVGINNNMISTLRKKFAGRNRHALKYAKLVSTYEYIQLTNYEMFEDDLIDILQCLPEPLEYFSADIYKFSNQFDYLVTFSKFIHLRVLDLQNSTLDITSICELIHVLPSLYKIRLHLVEIDQDFEGLVIEDIVNILWDNYGDIYSNLRIISLLKDDGRNRLTPALKRIVLAFAHVFLQIHEPVLYLVDDEAFGSILKTGTPEINNQMLYPDDVYKYEE